MYNCFFEKHLKTNPTAAEMTAPSPPIPLRLITPQGGGPTSRIGELWEYRELLYFLTLRDVKVRYKQTALGVLWAILQPLLTMIIFTVFFGRLAQIPSDGVPYPVFAYAGLLPWTFFANAVTAAGNSLVGSTSLITKVYFPRVIVPASAVCSGLLDLAVSFAVLVGLMAWYRLAPGAGVLLLPVLVALLVLLATGAGMWMAALNVRYRDVRYALPFLIQVWMFASPVIYPASLVPERWRPVLALNPMSGIIEGFRAALLGRAFDLSALGLSALVTVALLAASARAFQRMETSFADVA
jgi:homopolymeric O-antigen transport system permease protein